MLLKQKSLREYLLEGFYGTHAGSVLPHIRPQTYSVMLHVRI